jgi:hypothetical protein
MFRQLNGGIAMKKILSIALLVSISALAYSWDRASDDVIFGNRVMDAGVYREPVVRGPMSTPEAIARPTLYDSRPVVTETVIVDRDAVYPNYNRAYRPVRGVVGGAATAAEGAVTGAAVAAEGVVEGTAQAVNSLLP